MNTTKKMGRPKKNNVSGSVEVPESQMTIQGLGDVIATVTEFIGIPKCKSCEERQAMLNRFFPFTRTEGVEPLTERELEILKDMDATRTLKQEYMNEFFDAYNRRFVRNRANYTTPCQCPGVIKAFKEKLDLLRTED